MSSELSPLTVCVMAGPDSDHHLDEDSRLDFSIEAEMNQLSPLVSPLVTGPVSCVPPYPASQEVRVVTCPGPGPATSILAKETTLTPQLSQQVSCDNNEEGEEQEEEKEQEEQEEEDNEKEDEQDEAENEEKKSSDAEDKA